MNTIKKVCCPDCGFPIDLPREPILLRRNVIDFVKYQTDKCDNCGHQKDGSTIFSIHKRIQEMGNMYLRREKLICKFFEKYLVLNPNERKKVAVWFPQDVDNSDNLTPYSWDVVALEVTQRTTFGFNMLTFMQETLK